MRKKEKKEVPRLGKQPPRYKFFLNPYQDERFTRCPKCESKARQRKLPLVIHVDDWGLFVLNKTCRFCPGCELLIAHQDELEGYLAEFFGQQAPEIVGNNYLVIGTIDRADWKQGAEGTVTTQEMIDRLHDFEKFLRFELTPRWTSPE